MTRCARAICSDLLDPSAGEKNGCAFLAATLGSRLAAALAYRVLLSREMLPKPRESK